MLRLTKSCVSFSEITLYFEENNILFAALKSFLANKYRPKNDAEKRIKYKQHTK